MNNRLSKFVITSIDIMAGILVLIIIDSGYISDAHAQTNATDIGTKRIIAMQRITGISTDPVGNVYVVDADNKVYKSLMAQANS